MENKKMLQLRIDEIYLAAEFLIAEIKKMGKRLEFVVSREELEDKYSEKIMQCRNKIMVILSEIENIDVGN